MKNLTKIIVSITLFFTTLLSTSYLEARVHRRSERNVCQKCVSHQDNQFYAVDTGGSSYARTTPRETRYPMATAFAVAAVALILTVGAHNR